MTPSRTIQHLVCLAALTLLALATGSPAVPVAAGTRTGRTLSESWLITWDASTQGSGTKGDARVSRQSRFTSSIVVNYYDDDSSEYYANEYTGTYLFEGIAEGACDPEIGGSYRSYERREVTDPARYNGTGPVADNTIMPYAPTVWTGTKLTINFVNLMLDGLTLGTRYENTICDGTTTIETDSYDSYEPLSNLTSAVRSPFNSDDTGLFLYHVDTQFDITEAFGGVTYPLHLQEHLRVERLTGRDLRVREIEVTQGLQLNNTIPLVQGRRTIVRAYIDIGTEPGPIADVTGVLRVYSGTTLLGELQPFNWFGWIFAERAPDWHKIDDTLNFELPWLWTQSPSLRFEVEVNPTQKVGEINYTNNTSSVELPLRNCAPLSIGYLPIRFAPPGITPASPDADIARAQEFMRKVYPVADDELLYKPWPGMTWNQPIDAATWWQSFFNADDLVRALLIMQGYTSGPKVDRLVGWLPGGASQKFYGLASNIPGDRAWVGENKDPNLWRATLAHELGHTYGLRHNSSTTNGYHWFDVYERTIKPPNLDGGLIDFMITIEVPEEQTWVSPASYTFLYNQFCSGNPLRPAQPRTATDVLVVSGNVSLTDTQSGEFKSLYRVTGTELIPPAGSQYYVVLKNGTTVLGKYGFNPRLEADPTQGTDTPTLAPFVLAVPYPAGLNRVDLTDSSGSTLTSRTASANPPSVTVQFPNAAGLSLNGLQTIQWTGSDRDGDALTYGVLYSKDNGATWMALGADLTGTSYTVDFSTIPGSSSALIKVLASDGLLTSSDVSDQPFAVPTKPPVAGIVSPPTGAKFKVGEKIKLQGYAVDLEEGVVASSSLSWSSNLDGALGTGSLREVTLSKGTHTLKLDVPGAAAVTRTVVVDTSSSSSPQSFRLYLPLMVR